MNKVPTHILDPYEYGRNISFLLKEKFIYICSLVDIKLIRLEYDIIFDVKNY